MAEIGDQPTEPGPAPDTPAEHRLPDVFADRYEFRQFLGEGGMGAVVRVHDRELVEDVALKVLRAELSLDARALERFRREVKLARRVTHSNVARTYDVGRHEHLRFLTMELVVGESLSSLMRDGRRPPLAETLRIAEHIARGLSAAHAAGVVHRDLKPDNVMHCPGSNGRIVITDFGIAHLAEGVPASDDLRMTLNQVVGTPAYMAPEQLAGQSIDGRTDVYAFGTLLFEMLTGVLPFLRESALATVAARLVEDAPDPRTVDARIPESVALLIRKALARRRDERPDAEGMLQAIEGFRRGGDANGFVSSFVRTPPTLIGPLRTEPDSPRAVAIAPIDVSSGAPWSGTDLGFALADGLSSIRRLCIIGPDAVRDEASGRAARAVARDLGASWIVEATLRMERGRGRARARLVELDGGTHLWAAEPIDVVEGEGFALEDRLVRAVTDGLRGLLANSAKRPIESGAREAYDRAYSAASLRTFAGAQKAAAIAEEALAKFPGEPSLLCVLGASLVHLYALTGSADPQLAARAEEMSLRALAADPSLGEAYHAIGLLRSEQGETRAAIHALRESIARSPAFVDSFIGLGSLLVETGHLDEGLGYIETALRIDPRSSAARAERARTRALLGDREGAEVDLRDAGGAMPVLVRAVVWWTDRARAGELADAFERTPTGAPWEAGAPILRALSEGEAFAGTAAILERLVAGAHAAARNRCRIVEVASEIYGATGQHEAAFTWLEQVEVLPFVDIFWMDRCPCLDAMRGDARFVKLRGLVAARAADLWR